MLRLIRVIVTAASAIFATGVLAQATSDLLPYTLLACTCLATLAVLRSRGRRPAERAG